MKINTPSILHNFIQKNQHKYPINQYQTSPLLFDTVAFSASNNTKNKYQQAKNEFIETLYRDKKIPTEDIKLIEEWIEPQTLNLVQKMYNDKNFPICQIYKVIGDINDNEKLQESAKQGYKYYTKMYNQAFNNPERYVNEKFADPQSMIMEFFDTQNAKILKLAALEDGELNDILIRKRLDKFQKYLSTIDKFYKTENYEILKKSLKCTNPDNTPLNPVQKVQLINLLESYQLTNANTTDIKNMAENGVINIKLLKNNLINEIMKLCGYDKNSIKQIPNDKLNSWDENFIYLLPKQLKYNNDSFSNIIKLANNHENFKDQILNRKNEFGKKNYLTKKLFKSSGLNYDKWINPAEHNNINLTITENDNRIINYGSHICYKSFLQDVNTLRNTKIKTFIDKKYPQFIQNDKFILPEEILQKDQYAFPKFVKNFYKELEPVWQRAEKNIKNPNPEIQKRALITRTIQSHLSTISESLLNIENQNNNTKNIDLKIKMWDRIPQKDLFQGNYSTCCIGIGETNSTAMPEYLLNTAFNMIEIIDKSSNKTIGNALCYYGLDNKNEPLFIIDNIEINNSYRLTEKSREKIRNSITQYAQNINKEICPDKNIPIYLGKNYNDVPNFDLEETNKSVNLLGKLQTDDIYLDAFGGWCSNHKKPSTLSLKICST